MATVTSAQDLATLIEIRDNLTASYREISLTAISQYSFQDRQVLYEQRRFLRKEIDYYNRKILLAEGTATGTTKSDFANFPLVNK
tara:strand:+ start:434 stop:688 length:255 start_codon:yes stop_codon:yes gene_type:complete